MKKLALTAIAILLFSNLTFAQNEFHYQFRPALPPTTNVLATQGRLRLEFGGQGYIKMENEITVFGISIPVSLSTMILATPLLHYLLPVEHISSSSGVFLAGETRTGLSYTAWDNITLGAAYISSLSFDAQTTINPDVNTDFDKSCGLFELSGGYHRIMGRYWGFETRTSLGFGRGKYGYTQRYMQDTLTIRECDNRRYGIFNHSLEGGLSVFTPRRRVQLTLLVNAGYTRYYNVRPYTKGFQRSDLNNYEPLHTAIIPKGTVYVDPSLVLSLNARRVFSFQAHVGYPMGRHEGKKLPRIGFNMSFRILGKGNFERDWSGQHEEL